MPGGNDRTKAPAARRIAHTPTNATSAAVASRRPRNPPDVWAPAMTPPADARMRVLPRRILALPRVIAHHHFRGAAGAPVRVPSASPGSLREMRGPALQAHRLRLPP